MRPRTIATIGDYIDERYRVWGSCRGCGTHRLLDLEEVAQRVGRDYSPPEHKGRIPLRCGCGSRDVAITIHPSR